MRARLAQILSRNTPLRTRTFLRELLTSCGFPESVRWENDEEDCWLQLVDVLRLHVHGPLPDVIELQLPIKAPDKYERRALLYPAVEELLWELVIAYIAWGACTWIRNVLSLIMTSGTLTPSHSFSNG